MPENNNDFDKVYSRRSEKKPHYTKNSHKRKVGWTIFFVILVILIGGLIWGYGAYKNAKQTFNKTYDDANIQKSRNVSSVIKKGKPLSILLLGTDTGALGRHDTGRTDTLIVATVNPKTDTVNLTSIPRDTKVTVPGDTMSYEKINAAYTIGGANTAVKTAENLLNIPIDFYAIVNMSGLRTMVDAVGGIEITPSLTFSYGNAHVTKGQKVKLNGKQALDYARMRHDDPLGDYGRQKRQRQVLQTLVMKAINISSLTRYKTILKSLNGNMMTDMSFEDMVAVRSKYGDATHHIKSQTLQGSEAIIDGLSYQVIDENELLKVTNIIRTSLGLSKATALTDKQTASEGSSTDGYSDSTYDSGQSYGYDTSTNTQANNTVAMY